MVHEANRCWQVGWAAPMWHRGQRCWMMRASPPMPILIWHLDGPRFGSCACGFGKILGLGRPRIWMNLDFVVRVDFFFSSWMAAQPLSMCVKHSGGNRCDHTWFYWAQPARHHVLMFFHSKACRTFNYMHQYQTNLDSNYDRIDLKVDLEAVQARPLQMQWPQPNHKVANFHFTRGKLHFWTFEVPQNFLKVPSKIFPNLGISNGFFPLFPSNIPGISPVFFRSKLVADRQGLVNVP